MKLIKTFVHLYIYLFCLFLFLSIFHLVWDALFNDGEFFLLIKIIVSNPNLLWNLEFLSAFKIAGKLLVYMPAFFAAVLTLLSLGKDKKARRENGKIGLSVSLGYKIVLPAFMALLFYSAVHATDENPLGWALLLTVFGLILAPIQYRFITLEVVFDDEKLWVKNWRSGWSEYDFSDIVK